LYRCGFINVINSTRAIPVGTTAARQAVRYFPLFFVAPWRNRILAETEKDIL
jgi:hypothetical protein